MPGMRRGAKLYEQVRAVTGVCYFNMRAFDPKKVSTRTVAGLRRASPNAFIQPVIGTTAYLQAACSLLHPGLPGWQKRTLRAIFELDLATHEPSPALFPVLHW